MPKNNSQQKSTPDARVRHQQVGAEQRGAGGSGEAGTSQCQEGAGSTPERASPTKLQTGLQFLTKDFLRFWMADICLEGHNQRSAPQKRHKVHSTSASGN